jgi:hypothetical protein
VCTIDSCNAQRLKSFTRGICKLESKKVSAMAQSKKVETSELRKPCRVISSSPKAQDPKAKEPGLMSKEATGETHLV